MTPPGRPPDPAPSHARRELAARLTQYERSRNRWAVAYYTGKVSVIVLAAAIPVLTTLEAPLGLVSMVGGLIVVIEGISQLYSFHERYVASRMLYKGLAREDLLFQTAVRPYDVADADQREKTLIENVARLLATYDTQIRDVLAAQPVPKKP